MADDDGGSSHKPTSSHNNRPQETYQRGQEAQVEQRFPSHPAGIISLPRGSRGAKSLYLKREGNSFGFTLRHFIIYPPETLEEQDEWYSKVGALHEPMDTIFVKKVHDASPAKRAGLQYGDRLLAVNGIPIKDKTYNQVVQLIANSPDYLHLLVVPKEEDIIQRVFPDKAHNPISNQPEVPYDRQSAQQIIQQHIQLPPYQYRADPNAWRELQLQQQFYGYPDYGQLSRTAAISLGQRSADNLLCRRELRPVSTVSSNHHSQHQYHPQQHQQQQQQQQQEIYAEIQPNEGIHRQQRGSRAQPQVPLYRKMGRRASEGNSLQDREPYYDEPALYFAAGGLGGDDAYGRVNRTKQNYPHGGYIDQQRMLSLNYPPAAGCRLSMDGGRRESTSSLSSSNADGSKDSQYDSSSTLTDRQEDTRIIERIRNSFQQKEEFLRAAPHTSTEHALVHREFYGQPQKMKRSVWPPTNEQVRQESPSRSASKPNHQNFIRVKNDIDNERDLRHVVQQNGGAPGGGMANSAPPQRGVKSPKDKAAPINLDRIQEATVAPQNYDLAMERINGSLTMEDAYTDDRSMYPHMVHKRAREFESGRPLPEDDPMSNRINFTKNELARISSKKLVPNVTERAQEYEIRAVEPRRDNSGTSTNSGSTNYSRRIQRDARSLDSSDTSGNEAIRQRARSNSAESWVAALGSDDRGKRDPSKRISRQDAVAAAERKKANANEAADAPAQPLYADLPPLIPEPVERMHLAPSVSITPAPTVVQTRPARPNQLDLEGPVRPARHLKAPSGATEALARRSISPAFWDDKPVVVKRRPKNTNIADDERVVRRESYLKATEGGRVDFNIEHSDGELSPQRSAHRRYRRPYFTADIQQLCKLFEDASTFSFGGSVSGNSSSSASLDREKAPESPSDKEAVIREGPVFCKISEIDGKRATDRAWKPVWAVLRGPKLHLYKDKHHTSPVGSTDVVDHSLADGVDMRTSVVRVAEDYTKRKNVLRVSSVKPCRSEFLLQTDDLTLGEWVKVLQEQVATTTEAEARQDHLNSTQQAVPQTIPASTTIQVQGSHLSPQLGKGKNSAARNRSPTGQSPVSKTRKPSHTQDPTTSPKSKNWAGRMYKQLHKKIQGGTSPSSPTAPEVSTFGIPIEQCLPSTNNPFVPKVVDVCTSIVEEKGLQIVGIYRVPGNNASITALTDEINKNYEDVPMDDQKWNDVNVVSSILKSYFRKMPDSLITVKLYPCFINAAKIEDPTERLKELKRLVKSLPPHNYETLKHIVLHLSRVVEKSEINKMEAKNLAIVFGPTIVRSESDNMESMVNNMTNQCKIVEILLNGAEYFFSDNDPPEPLQIPPLVRPEENEYIEQGNHALLLNNINKYEAIGKEGKDRKLLHSLVMSAAQRIKKTPKQANSSQSKEEVTTPTSPKSFSSQLSSLSDLKESTTTDSKVVYVPASNAEREMENSSEKLKRRLEKFNRETQEDIQKSRWPPNDFVDGRGNTGLSSSAGNVNQQNARLSLKPAEMMKTHSASNVYARLSNTTDHSRNSLGSMEGGYPVQYSPILGSLSLSKQSYATDKSGADHPSDISDRRGNRTVLRRGSSVENINSSSLDLNANGGLKKVKYEKESDLSQRSGSLESLNKQSDGVSDLMKDLTKAYDQIKQKHNLLSGEDLPFVDESPDKQQPPQEGAQSDKENIPGSNDLYKNPSLHKTQYVPTGFKLKEIKYKESKRDAEKDEDTMTADNVPDNERNISTHNKLTLAPNTNKLNSNGSKLRRSESLNKPERTVSPQTIKLKRSESLNKTGDKLKRSDSLTKNEKTESNNNKRRELSTSGRRSKENTKLKRKNGMPDRSIKRRHTVGGTKDPDKVTYLDNKSQEDTSPKENKDKNLRTSSPDLSSTRRERLCLEINLVGPEDMVVALRQHFIGARPQSFPESVFKVPLESHV
ncbi:rho GTPase-activating protein 21-B isoform X5 [Aethina tumida]|uniref:rho GTPase-activating protein 21-B isoform X5 n=1 Tax=Aethina tumida TaxID=116153 RepID=UPI002147898D|nr:rho GTPase-activating protein 21-B isoform X5 [Aethina tumida]